MSKERQLTLPNSSIGLYTWLKKRCLAKSTNHERCDIMEFWENSTARLLLLLFIFKEFLAYEEVLEYIHQFFLCHYDVHGVWESKQDLQRPRKPLGRIVNGLCYLPNKVSSIRCMLIYLPLQNNRDTIFGGDVAALTRSSLICWENNTPNNKTMDPSPENNRAALY